MKVKKPVLIVIDIQKEYLTPGRSYQLSDVGPSLVQARGVLNQARAQGWVIVHVKHLNENGEIFSGKNEYSDYAPGFEPCAGEFEVIKHDFSSYSSPRYRDR